ncbi:MAG: DUF3368 domain-containing protein [Anaerolineae bacterium CFX3]|nr:hypothetical protein [Anaerolineales bacterium]MCC7511199.1 DUF3368 domain-containing protein [Anaerolineae bacterium]MCE7904744.1 DUF3368 domain-containing protein [Anaerolineae bacterium CFX3]MBW7919388.1 DUF3368 domain-containing protein [Anaerolineales bacterium]MCQ3945894.1 DUF3368 domain-containing protein [Anaerolineae bacterium]
MKVVSNSTPLIGLASIGRLGLLRDFFEEIGIAEAVYDETVTNGHERGAKKISSAKWIHVHKVQDRLAIEMLLDELDLGEAETIVLAREISADIVLMDEKQGRRMLDQLELPKIGTVGILLRARQTGLVKSLRSELDKLRRHGFTLSQFVVDRVLAEADE